MSEADPDIVRVRLAVSYDGTAFAGWARQPGQRTVQGELEDALATVLRLPSPPRLTVAGRTDAGVHARGQVAHVDLPSSVWAQAAPRLVWRLRRFLAADVQVLAATVAPPGFDARFSALWRRYEYRICDAPAGIDPLRRGFVVAWPRPLDTEAMAQRCGELLGLHDFAAFCKRRDTGTTIRTLQQLDVARADNDELVVSVQADAFCHSMVRSLVGALSVVGEGRRPSSWLPELLDLSARAVDVPVAPAHGLTLLDVAYPPDAELGTRAEAIRALRTR